MSESLMVTLLVFSLLLLGIVLSVVWFIHKARQQKIQEQEAMNQFQMEMKREFVAKDRVSKVNDAEHHAESRFPSPQEKEPHPPVAASVVSGIVSPTSAEPEAASATRTAPLTEQVIMRLKEANLFESSEGPYFPLDPSGECLLIRLKQKKTALLVPRFESRHFIQNALKRFDYVFLIFSKEDVIVLNSFSGFIAGHFKLS